MVQIQEDVRTKANKLFQMIGEANEVLSNPATRSKLDSDLERDELSTTASFYGNPASTVPSSYRQHYESSFTDDFSYSFRRDHFACRTLTLTPQAEYESHAC